MSSDPVVQASAPLLSRIAAGDASASKELIAEYGDLLWSLALRFEATDAEDAVQEILVDIWKSAGRYDPVLGGEITFIAMIARRRLIDRKRRAVRRPTSERDTVIAELEDPRMPPDTAADAATAGRALEKLRTDQRRVVTLATCGGLSHGEIAAETGLPLGTVKAHARRGLLAIRLALFGPAKPRQP